MDEKRKFYVLTWDFNRDKIEHYDVLPYLRNRLEERIEKNKKDEDEYFKVPKSFDEFKKFVEDESLYQFWSRCEYEIILKDWPCGKTEEKWDIYDQIMMNLDIITNLLMETV